MKTRVIHGKLHLIYDAQTDDFYRSSALLRMYQNEAEHNGDTKTLGRLRMQETKLRDLRRKGDERP